MIKNFQMPLHATSKSVYLILFVFLSLIVPVWSASATDFGRPLALEGPTEVTIAVFILDIDEVNSASQSFDANVYLELHWHDPRLRQLNRGGRHINLC